MASSPASLNVVLLFAQDETAERIERVLAGRPDVRLFQIPESADLLLAPAYNVNPDVVIIGPGIATLQKIRWITRLRAVLPHVGLVVVGQYHDEAYGAELMEFGANAYVGGDEIDTRLVPAIMAAAGRQA